jgi:hypothetical protein
VSIQDIFYNWLPLHCKNYNIKHFMFAIIFLGLWLEARWGFRRSFQWPLTSFSTNLPFLAEMMIATKGGGLQILG